MRILVVFWMGGVWRSGLDNLFSDTVVTYCMYMLEFGLEQVFGGILVRFWGGGKSMGMCWWWW